MPEFSEMSDAEYADHLEDKGELLKGAGFEESANEKLESSRRIKNLLWINERLQRLSQPYVELGGSPE